MDHPYPNIIEDDVYDEHFNNTLEYSKSQDFSELLSFNINKNLNTIEEAQANSKALREIMLKRASQPCPYFKLGKGMCPYGGVCHFAHINEQGKPVDKCPKTDSTDRDISLEFKDIEIVPRKPKRKRK